MSLPIERFKDAYKNWRYNPFTDADMAVDKEEDHLFIPSGSPFLVQLLEQPRKNEPSSVTVYCYDDVAYFTEVETSPAQGEFRVDYPPEDGKGTGLLEFNQNDAEKEIRVNYKATGSPSIAEFLDTKVSYPATVPNDHQVIGFVSGAPEWRYNPVCYFHEGPVLYHASGEDESCLLFRFKRSAKQATVILELKGAKLHQGYYTELKEHLHAKGTLAGSQPTHTHGVSGETAGAGAEGAHTHGVGTLAVGNAGGHSHNKGSLVGSQPTHQHGVSGNTENANIQHQHGKGSLAGSQPTHVHAACRENPGTSGAGGGDAVTIAGNTANMTDNVLHAHSISFNTGAAGNEEVTISGSTDSVAAHNHALSGETAEGGAGASHNHTIDLESDPDGDDAVTITGSTANTGGSPKTYPDQLKVYINGVDKTTEILALTALTQFGDGTGSHAFVTTGSGEMDISSLFAAAQIHELKITEPTSAKGGRVLLHLEVY